MKKIETKNILKGVIKALIFIFIACIIYATTTQNQIADSVVRLHIVANSDLDADQALKLEVRDAILDYMKTRYPNGASKAEAANYLKSNLNKIEEIASQVLAGNGSTYKVSANYGVYPFPTKEYHDVSLPAGSYEAVRVELGLAEGENWWCIMFPPLCVADASSLKFEEDAMSQLKDGLSEENYHLITDITHRGTTSIKLKFRIVEIVENSKIRISKLLNNLF